MITAEMLHQQVQDVDSTRSVRLERLEMEAVRCLGLITTSNRQRKTYKRLQEAYLLVSRSIALKQRVFQEKFCKPQKNKRPRC